MGEELMVKFLVGPRRWGKPEKMSRKDILPMPRVGDTVVLRKANPPNLPRGTIPFEAHCQVYAENRDLSHSANRFYKLRYNGKDLPGLVSLLYIKHCTDLNCDCRAT